MAPFECAAHRVGGEAADAKVAHLDLARRVYEYVGWFDVPMHKLQLAHVLECTQHCKRHLGHEQLGHCQLKCEQLCIEAIQRRVHHLCQNPDVRLKEKII